MEVTDLLRRVHSGDSEAFRDVIPLVYDELKKVAAGHLRRQSNRGPLEATSLVHELFLRMVERDHPDYENRTHFYRIASYKIRQLLVDMARARNARKRGRDVEVHVPDPQEIGSPQRPELLLALDEALDRLAKEHPVKAQLVEMRYFGGMTAEDSAEALSLPVHAVRRELRLAHAWLHRELAS
jgi:RNA polymerase sigma-70 factor (ECF subfamily)